MPVMLSSLEILQSYIPTPFSTRPYVSGFISLHSGRVMLCKEKWCQQGAFWKWGESYTKNDFLVSTGPSYSWVSSHLLKVQKTGTVAKRLSRGKLKPLLFHLDQVFQPWHCWHLALDNSCEGAVLCIVGCSAAPLASNHKVQVRILTHTCHNEKCLQTLPKVPGRRKGYNIVPSWKKLTWRKALTLDTTDLSLSLPFLKKKNVEGKD